MKPEEAIKRLEFQIVKASEYSHGQTQLAGYWKDVIKAYKTAIQALKKQIPKKPNIKEFPHAFGPLYWNVCGACDEEIDSDYEYCPDCGQRIDWGESE